MAYQPDRAFILAAGMGKRLRPYTDSVPKPMVEVGGRPIIDRTIDRLIGMGVTHITVNTHYMADIIEEHLSRRDDVEITFSREETLLDTGGGIKKALHAMGGKPFYVIAGDAVWTDGPSGDSLLRLAKAWNPQTMDILTLMQPLSGMTLTDGVGDYDLTPDGRTIRRPDKSGAYMWTNIRINSPAVFDDTPDGVFSFLQVMDRAEAAGRFHALEHDGQWHHISTAAELERVNAHLDAQKKRA
ncbi:MAG TPA: nucleotidyltransferase family protein [Alphaproteobacteria bacterium]